MPAQQPDITQLLISLALLAIEGGLLVFFILMACFSWQYFRKTWRPAVAFGILLFVLGLPPAILALAHFDPTKAAPELTPDLRPVITVVAAFAALAILIAMIPLRALYLHVAAVEWSRLKGNPDTDSTREMLATLAGPAQTQKAANIVGAIIGLLCAIVTLIIMSSQHVRESEALRQMQQMFPTIEQTSPFIALPIAILFVCAAAISEEVIFRGALLGFLLRITRNRTSLAWLSILFVAFVWSLLHVFNTDHPMLKVTQIFLHGIALGYLTRRWGLLCAISSHVALNLAAVIAPLLVPSLR